MILILKKLYEFANASNTSAESLKQSYRMTSWLGRVNYNYDNKYYLGVSYRRDGSSRLARKNRWGNFGLFQALGDLLMRIS